MVVLLVMVFLFFQLFKFHLALTVKDTFDFNKNKDVAMSLYNLEVTTENGCEKNVYPSQDCNIPIIFELSSLNFLSDQKKDIIKSVLDTDYKSFLGKGDNPNYFLSLLKLRKEICLKNGNIGEGTSLRCTELTGYDLGLVYPLPVIPNNDFKNNPVSLLNDLTFQIKG